MGLVGQYPQVCAAMRSNLRHGDIIINEVKGEDYSVFAVKYSLRKIADKNQVAANKSIFKRIDDMADQAVHYIDSSFTVSLYTLVLVISK
jgi:hypothetical protein